MGSQQSWAEAGLVPQHELLPVAARTAACAYLSLTTSLMFPLSIVHSLFFASLITRNSGELSYVNVAPLTTATVLQQIIHQTIHVLEVGGVGDRPPISVRFNKLCCCQNIQMKGESWSGEFEAASYFSCRKA